MRQGSQSRDVIALWNSGRASRVKLIALQLLRLFIGAAFVSYIFGRTLSFGWAGEGRFILGIFVVLAVIFSIVFSPRLRKQGERMTKTFTENLTERER